ncbi:MAG: FAD-binding protein [Leptolyngbya sp. SIO3F4]|nr:FAD-binding protein [Leptolyngbya sp. SIO3F4]
MVQTVELVLSPEEAAQEDHIKRAAARKLGVAESEVTNARLLRRSIDARSRSVKMRLRAEVFLGESPIPPTFERDYPSVHDKDPVHIIGTGPAGLFAALRLIELGYRPILLERGKDVKQRRKDISLLHTKHVVHPDSNYCFGEGGAGTYSDGKLYTRSKKRGDLERILQVLVAHGASEDILIDAHPHIGTNKLPKIVATMREQIRACGGEVHFEARVTDIRVQFNRITHLELNDNAWVPCERVILATGHSARDVFAWLHRNGVLLEAKPFALGVRVEHPQRLIDSIQYHCGPDRGKYLPAASYSLVEQVQGRGVYSFCMCPGGFIVPSATAPGEVVVNGMSTSTRSSRYANSGMVVSIEPEDWQAHQQRGPLAAMAFQQAIEQQVCTLGGGDQTAPAQRLVDFVQGRVSADLPDCSYLPGTKSTALHEGLPPFVAARLRQAFTQFGKKMKGYYTNEAQVLAVESRTSSPVKLPRDPKTLQHVQIENLYPCGEGAGYAGGIISAAMDGERVAQAIPEHH